MTLQHMPRCKLGPILWISAVVFLLDMRLRYIDSFVNHLYNTSSDVVYFFRERHRGRGSTCKTLADHRHEQLADDEVFCKMINLDQILVFPEIQRYNAW